tara:strand:- start:18917 stop:19567 length:651 start_codon:yes stop_codon:yes gene_type:complete
MKKDTVNTLCVSPFSLVKNQESFYKSLIVIILSVLTLPGCITSNPSVPLAPHPPDINISTMQEPVFTPHYFADAPVVDPLSIALSVDIQDSGFAQRQGQVEGVPVKTAVALGEDKCRIQDRFDHKAVLAYEWGYQRIGLDVDGVELGGSDDAGIRLEYKMNLQRKKNREQKCRYSSQWQGLVGSGYHELFVREDATVWQELRDIRGDVADYMDQAF